MEPCTKTPVPRSFTTVLDAGIAAGTRQVRIIGLSPAGAPVGLFSDTVTVVIQ